MDMTLIYVGREGRGRKRREKETTCSSQEAEREQRDRKGWPMWGSADGERGLFSASAWEEFRVGGGPCNSRDW